MSPEIMDWIIKGVVALVTGLITTFLVPALVKWKNNLQQTNLQKFISSTVRAAEQIFGPGTAPLKKEYVINAIKEKYGNKLDVDTLDTLIEAAVYEISQALKNEQTKYTEAAVEAAEKKMIEELQPNIKEVEEDQNNSGSTGVKLG